MEKPVFRRKIYSEILEWNSNNKEIIYNGEDIVNVLKEISFILCSLHDTAYI